MGSPMRTISLPSGDQIPVLGQGTWGLGESRARRSSEIAALRRGLDIGMNLIRRMRVDLSQVGIADAEPKLIGKSINLMLSPLPARKRVRKFSVAQDGDRDGGDRASQEASSAPAPQEPAPALNGKK